MANKKEWGATNVIIKLRIESEAGVWFWEQVARADG